MYLFGTCTLLEKLYILCLYEYKNNTKMNLPQIYTDYKFHMYLF